MQTEKFLIFKVEQIVLALRLANIDKITLLPALANVPLGKNYLAGLLNLHGQSIFVLDLALRLSLEKTRTYTLATPLLVCNFKQNKIALIIDDIIDFKQYAKEQLALQEEFQQGALPYLATLKMGNDLALLLDLSKIMDMTLNLNFPDSISEVSLRQEINE